MSDQITFPQNDSESDQILKPEEHELETEALNKDFKSDPLNEIHQLLEDTAEDILQASDSTELWPNLVCLFLWLLDDRAPNSLEWENHLISIRDQITKRLESGRWY